MNELTVNEAADRLRVSPEKVKRLLRAGDLEGSLASRKSGWRISEAAFQKYYAYFGPDADPPVIVTPELEQGVRRDTDWAVKAVAELEKQPRTRQVRKLLRQVRALAKQGRDITTTLDEIKAAGIVAESEAFAQAADRMAKQ
jgi:excisionase family DNA binding protein